MTERASHSVVGVVAETLLGGLVVLLTVPTGVGPAAGGWLAARTTAAPARGLAVSAVAGLLGALPWGVLVYLAASGAIAPIGYHEGPVHVGVNTAAPGLLTVWQEVALALLVGVVVAGTAVAGGFLAWAWTVDVRDFVGAASG
jgi:hypothetical protein